MSGKKDVYSEVKGQMRLSERIAAFIPGFRGYKEKEIRRESDRLIRNHLNLKLTAAKESVRDIFQKLTDRRYFDVITETDRLVAKMDRITEKVNHASYGYSGFFDAVKIKEESLDRMIDFDNQLIDDVEAFSADVTAFKTELAGGETKNMKERIQALTDKLDVFESAFDRREEVILGVI